MELYKFAVQKMKEKQEAYLSEVGNLRLMESVYQGILLDVADGHDEARLRRMEVDLGGQRYLVSVMYDEYYISIRSFFQRVVRWQLTE